MNDERRNAFNQFAIGAPAEKVARTELGMKPHEAQVAAAQGVGSAIEYVRRTKAQRKAAHKRVKLARRRMRG